MRQIQLSPQGLWHRPINGHTACDFEVTGPVASRDGYGPNRLDLCPVCFTPKERDVSTEEMRRIAREAIIDAAAENWFDDAEKTNPEIIVIPNDHTRIKKK